MTMPSKGMTIIIVLRMLLRIVLSNYYSTKNVTKNSAE